MLLKIIISTNKLDDNTVSVKINKRRGYELMGTNSYFIQLAITIVVIFGGTFIIRYLRTGELLLDQIICLAIGVILLFASLVWRKLNKQS